MEKKSLHEIRQFSEQSFTKRIVFQQGEGLIFILNFMPGQVLPSHSHPGAVVTLMVLEGGGKIFVDGNESEVSEGDMIQLAGNETFSFVNSEHLQTSLYVFLSKVPSEVYSKNV